VFAAGLLLKINHLLQHHGAFNEDTELEDFATNLKALTWALYFAEELAADLDRALHSMLMDVASERDRVLTRQVVADPPSRPPSPETPEEMAAAGADELPFIVVDLPDMCVVHKAPGWEVDCADVGSGLLLSNYLRRYFSVHEAPLVHHAQHQFGMVHRLDRVSSGLLLIGKSFRGFHSLHWQLNTCRLEREYVVLVHGWVSPTLRHIAAKVLHVHAEGQRESLITEQGKPAQTHVTTVGHYTLLPEREEPYSLVVIQIVTGRRHQIRAHMCHVGHPTVADGKYTTREVFVRDKQWCARNFLHRYRLGFEDVCGNRHEATARLPRDLRESFTHLAPVDMASDAATMEWLSCNRPRAWAEHNGL